jgi:hypothetical protein
MDSRFWSGLGLAAISFFLRYAAISFFLRYAVKDMPRPIAWLGVLFGMLIMAASIVPSTTKYVNFSAIQRWLTREPRRNRSLASSEQPRVGAWPDFKKWDQREKFELCEAACLWFDREPVLPMPRNAQEKYQEWKRMILGGRLSVTGLILRDDIEIAMKRKTAINPHLIIYREVLEEVAKHDNVEPRFLFPYRRGEI